MRRHHERRSNNGFTLVEVLVALVIFTLAFSVLAQIIQTGLRQSAAARSLGAATSLAQSELARVGVEVPLQVGRAEGDTEDSMRWHTEIELVQAPTETQRFAIYQVQITVAWGPSQAEQLTLTTLRVGLPPE